MRKILGEEIKEVTHENGDINIYLKNGDKIEISAMVELYHDKTPYLNFYVDHKNKYD